MACRIESGVQLFSRLNSRPSLENIDDNIFTNGGPFPNEVIEVVGDVATGKTILMTEMIAKVILPTKLNHLKIGGKNAGAILINNDQHFDIFRLVSIMEKIINDCRNETNNLNLSDIENIIKESLEKLIILDVYDSHQMRITFHGLEKILSDNTSISIIFIDSLSAYYWSDSLNEGNIRMDLYQRNLLRQIQTITNEYKIVLMYTKPSYFNSKPTSQRHFQYNECSKDCVIERINYRIFLSENDSKNHIYIAEINRFKEKTLKYFKINVRICWLESNNPLLLEKCTN